MSQPPIRLRPAIVRFGPFRANLETGELQKGETHIRLQQFPFAVLRVLIERAGDGGESAVTRNDLRRLLWDQPAGDFDAALNTAIRKIRSALIDSPENPRYVETLPRLGYRFICEIEPEIQDPPRRAGLAASAVATESVKRKNRYWWASVGLFAVVVFAGGVLLDRHLDASKPAPHITGTVQLTDDGSQKESPLVSDGKRLYFNEKTTGGWSVMAVSTSGSTRPAVVEGAAGLYLADVARDGTEMLLQEVPIGNIERDRSYSIMPLPQGRVRRLGITGHGASWSPDGRKLAWANGDGLWVGARDGSGGTRILSAGGEITHLVWNPGGRAIRFALKRQHEEFGEIQEVGVDGSGYRPVVQSRSNPGGWTPDGRYFLYDDNTIHIMSAPSELLALRENGAGSSGATHVAAGPFILTAGMLKWEAPLVDSSGGRIYAMGRKWRGLLSHYDASSQQFVPYLNGISADGVVFSRDGQWVAYTLWPERTLWRSHADGSDRAQLTFPPMKAFYPRWSPDGTLLAFSSGPSGDEPGHWKVHTIQRAGGAMTTLPEENQEQAIAAWSPDGESILLGGAPWMENWAPDSTTLRIFSRRTGKIAPFPGGEGLWAPKWSPDGRYIAAETVDSRVFMIYDRLAPVRGWHELSKVSGVIGYSAWSHDGRYLYFNTSSDQKIQRIRISDARTEDVLRVSNFRVSESQGEWFGLAPDDTPLMLRDISIQEIFRFDAVFP